MKRAAAIDHYAAGAEFNRTKTIALMMVALADGLRAGRLERRPVPGWLSAFMLSRGFSKHELAHDLAHAVVIVDELVEAGILRPEPGPGQTA